MYLWVVWNRQPVICDSVAMTLLRVVYKRVGKREAYFYIEKSLGLDIELRKLEFVAVNESVPF